MLSNDVINKSDYLGRYEIDFHFYVIYYILRAKCFCANDAYNVAYYSQHVDDDMNTSPFALGFLELVNYFGPYYQFGGVS